MTSRHLMKKMKFSQQDFQDIEKEVQNAESRTSGEIALAITAESSDYAFFELVWAVVSSLLVMVCLLPCSQQISDWLNGLFWQNQSWYLPAFFIAAFGITTVLFYLLYNIPALDSLVIPGRAKTRSVTAKAFKHWTESGVYATENHSGVLIFVSYFEREVRIIADKGISKKISNDIWNIVADEMRENLAAGNIKKAYMDAIHRCGELLEESFPVGSQKKNELADGLVILESGAL